jgi:hypothetical protein
MPPSAPQPEPGEQGNSVAEPLSRDTDGTDAHSADERAYLQILSIHSLSLEMRAAIIFPAEVLALFVLWEHLYDFDLVVPRTFAWIAWSLLIFGIFVGGWLIAFATNRDSALSRGANSLPTARHDLDSRIHMLSGGIRLSVIVALVALALTALGYAIDKAG